MANKLLIVGDTGTGKSTSMRNLDPNSTFIVNVENKSLPWKGSNKQYKKLTKEYPEGNLYSTDSTEQILAVMDKVNKMEHIKTLIIDDMQYVQANEYMRRATEKGFEKYTLIGKNMWVILNKPKEMRDNLTVIFMIHSEVTDDGMGNKSLKAKTLGKMIDSYITVEGMFTIVLYTLIEKTKEGNKHYFLTENNGSNTCKTPMGMFKDSKIPNDLVLVIEAMNKYYDE